MVTVLNALRLLISDVAKLFKEPASLWFALLSSLVLQGLFWYVATPGPRVLSLQSNSLLSSISNIGWTLVLLLFVPQLLLLILRIKLPGLSFSRGDARFGIAATAGASLIAVVAMFFGSMDASVQSTYPWAGAWVGESVANLATWALLYGLYYVSFEFFYRGFMLRTLEAHWGLSTALWVQTIASTLIHVGKPLPELLAAIPAGLIFGVLAVRSRSLLYPLLLHLVIGLSTDIFSLYHQGLLLP